MGRPDPIRLLRGGGVTTRHDYGTDPPDSTLTVDGSGVSALILNGPDLDVVARLVDHDARRIAQLLWNHIGAASFADLEPFTLKSRRNPLS